MSERPLPLRKRLPQIALGAGLVILVPGLAALATGQVLLFPSLGPSALMQAHAPDHATARPYNVLVGHAVGLAAAFLFVALFGLSHAPSVFEIKRVTAARVIATALALTLAAALEVLLDAAHPPAASTTLLASLGSFKPTWPDTLDVAIGVVLVTIAGEALRRYRLRSQHTAAD